MSAPTQHVVTTKENDVRHSLYKATIIGDWKSLENLLKHNQEAISTPITPNSGTVLHLAIATNKKESFLRNLFASTSLDVIRMTTEEGDTALHHAASFGNLEAVKLLVSNDPQLPNIPNHNSLLPLHEAAKSAQREVFTYLFGLTKDDVDPRPFEDDRGTKLVENLVTHGLCDLALELVKKYTHLATKPESLRSIACRTSNFFSNIRSSTIMEQAILTCLIIHRSIRKEVPALEIAPNILSMVFVGTFFPQLLIFILGEFVFSSPRIKKMKAGIKAYDDSVTLAKFICKELQKIVPNEAKVIFQNAAKAAAKHGSPEILKEIMEACPAALILEKGDRSIGIFHIAVEHRQIKVFDLIFQMSSQKDALLSQKDDDGNTILHIASTLPSSDRLNQDHSAALQMQHEMLWYKAVEENVPAWLKNAPNNDGITPSTLFTEQHKDLLKEGEKWMRDTANAGIIAATLISTISFAAAITVPGGNNDDTGFPIFSKKVVFLVFAISNAISLILSITSLLMFLSLLTARYAERDFLESLPSILIVALTTLVFSIFYLIITFGTTIYLVNPGAWLFWLLLILLGFYPVSFFYVWELPLLIVMLWNVIFAEDAIFHKQGKRLLF